MIPLVLLLLVSVSSATVATDIISTNGGVWNAPSGVFTTNIQAIGGGSAGDGGGVVWQYNADRTYYNYELWTGPGGNAGSTMTWNNVVIVPGTGYTCYIGTPGSGIGGFAYQMPDASGTVSFPIVSYTAGNGHPTWVNISGTQYIANGGVINNVTVIGGGTGSDPIINPYGSINGALGILSSLYFAISGTSTAYGSGGTAGYGYGAGGGGGGPGDAAIFGNFVPGGAGGAGGQGAIAFTYNTNSVAFYPYGYVTDQFGNAISGATVSVSSVGITQVTSSSGAGYYYSSQPATTGFPVNITASKTGYTTEAISFTPQIATAVQINLTLVNPSTITVNGTSIYGITYLAPYYQPYGGADYHVYNSTTGENYVNTTMLTGYGQNGGLMPNQAYKVWSSASGMNSTIYNVVAVGS